MSFSRLPPSGNAVSPFSLLRPPPGDFRRTFPAHCGFAPQDILYTGSGTAALELALRGLKGLYADRREVALPAWCCPSVGQAVLAAGLKPVQVDLSPESLTYVPEALDQAVSANTLAVLLVHFFGIAHPRPKLRHPPPFFIRDCAQAYDFRYAGEEDAVFFYSFGRGKSLNVGHGGALALPPSSPLARGCRDLLAAWPEASTGPLAKAWLIETLSHPVAFGLVSRLPFLGVGQTFWDQYPCSTRMHPGFFRWAMACAQTLDGHRQAYADLARQYADVLSALPGAIVPTREFGPENFPLRFPCLIPDRAMREKLRRELNRDFGGVTGQYPAILEKLPGVPENWPRGGSYPGCERITREILTFPITAWLLGREKEFCHAIRRIAAS